MGERKLDIVQGFSGNDTVFFIYGCQDHACDCDGNFYKDSDGNIICEETKVPFKRFYDTESFEQLWFHYSNPSDIRNYRSPRTILLQYDYKDVVSSDTCCLVDLNVNFNNTFDIYAKNGKNNHQKVVHGELPKNMWDMNSDDVEQIMNDNEEKIVNFLNNCLLLVA